MDIRNLKRRRRSKTPAMQATTNNNLFPIPNLQMSAFQPISTQHHPPPRHVLWQFLKCAVCQNMLKDPITLSCGNTVCARCMPSYKDLAFVCPVTTCARPSHVLLRKAKIDVTLVKLLDLANEQPQQATEEMLNMQLRKRIEETLECPICACLFLDPVTTPCGHTMCLRCLLRTRDNSELCPTCRTRLPAYALLQTLAISSILYQILIHLFHDEYHRNANDVATETNDDIQLPLFVHTSVTFPTLPCAIHIYEPRYMTMLRRCLLQPQRRFGICFVRHPNQDNQEPFQQIGTMLEIQNVSNVDHDRSIVETIGAYRFKVVATDLKDGYHVARWEQINDLSPEEQSYQERMEIMTATARKFKAKNKAKANASIPAPGSGPTFGPAMLSLGTMIVTQGQAWASRSQGSSSAQQSPPTDDITDLEIQSTEDIIHSIRQFIESFRNANSSWMQQHNARFGPAPDSSNAFIWWAAMTIPLSEQEKYRLLQVNTTRERAKLLMIWINALKQKWWYPVT
ncbi:PUA-like domain-containing protein [Umbelopsis sp. PMI_123]|nr:PUA-like domain-containing protein [Umbelopsis sp. PMI_123]